MTDAVPNGKNKKSPVFTKKMHSICQKNSMAPEKLLSRSTSRRYRPSQAPHTTHLTDCPEICSVLDQRSAGDMSSPRLRAAAW